MTRPSCEPYYRRRQLPPRSCSGKLQGAGAGILFIAPGGEHLKYALQLLFPASNNAAEYEALIHGLNIAISLGIKRLMVYGDSLVVISQINKE
jgi:ribonuclease HI